MSASLQERAFPTFSSSGHTDGLGRRVLAFDRETGVLTEHLLLRPELTAFASGIQQRIDALAALTDPHFATPGSIVRHRGEVIVISEFVSGSRLSDLLDLAQERGLVPGVDAAVGYLLDALEGLATLHTTCRVPHGLIAPARTMLTADGRVVFLDCLYAAVVERLGLSAARLWKDFRVAVMGRPRGVRLEPSADVAQAALGAVMLVLGRNLDDHEFPTGIPALIGDFYDLAQIGTSETLADRLRRFLVQALPHPGPARYADAGIALAQLRAAIAGDLDPDGCRTALAGFVAQTSDAPTEPGPPEEYRETDQERRTGLTLAPTLDRQAAPHEPLPADTSPEDDEAEALRALLASAALDDMLAPGAAPEEPSPDRIDAEEEDELEFEIQLRTPARKGKTAFDAAGDDEEDEDTPAGATDDDEDEPPPNIFDLSGNDADAAILDRFGFGFNMPPKPEPKPFVVDEEPAPEPALASGSGDPPAGATPASVPPAGTVAESAPAGSRSRRKKHEKKSARARKDKLRSTVSAAEPAEAGSDGPTVSADGAGSASREGTGAAKPGSEATPSEPPPAQAPPSAAPPGSTRGWLVPPEKAAHFDPGAVAVTPVQPVFGPPPSVQARPTVPSVPPVSVLSHAATPPAPVQATVTPPGPPVFAAAPRLNPPPAAPRPAAAAPVVHPTPPPEPQTSISAGPVSKLSTLKLKDAPPTGFAPKRRPRPAAQVPVAPVMPLSHAGDPASDAGGRGFPKKLAVLLLVVVAAAIAAGRFYLVSRAPVADDALVGTAPGAAAPAPTTSAAAAATIKIQSQPEGARVLLDDRAVGTTPLTLTDVPAGRHTVTLVSKSATVSRPIRLAAGQTLDLDVPLFSGWVAIYAPVVLHVTEQGKSLGTTEEARLMLPPGRHRLTLSNPELGYRTRENVDVTAGETTTLRLTPTGLANLNAAPWAEVFFEGKKLGDTPLAGVSLPLGNRELVFKHPQLGERRVSVLIRGNQATPVSVDLTR